MSLVVAPVTQKEPSLAVTLVGVPGTLVVLADAALQVVLHS